MKKTTSAKDLCFVPAHELVRGYAARKFSPLEVMEAVYARIDAVNPRVNALVTLTRDQAFAAARVATKGLRKGAKLKPLHGVPVSIKDVTPTAGVRTTYGSKIFENNVPSEDALQVERLKAAGAIVIGKSNTPEFAAGAHSFNDVFGVTRNPWNTALSAGGSTGGGAAAVACGMGAIAEGSDLGGSLRTPSAFNGVVGFRASPGLVPFHPTTLAWNSLSIQGPVTRTVPDTALALSVMAGADDRDPKSYEVDTQEFQRAVKNPSIKGWKIAFDRDLNGLVPVDAEIADIAQDATKVFRKLGAKVDKGCPDFTGFVDVIMATRGIAMVAAHAAKLKDWRDTMQAGLVWNIEQGLSLTPAEIARAEVLRSEIWHRVRRFMADYDLLILPGTGMRPFPVEWEYPPEIAGQKLTNYMECFYLTYAVSIAGLPVISVPCGFTKAGMPTAIQIVGRRHRDADVLRAAAAFERAMPWTQWRPTILNDLPAAGS